MSARSARAVLVAAAASALFVPVPSALAVDVGCPPAKLWELVPRGSPTNPWDIDSQGAPILPSPQGTNGITLQGRTIGNGRFFALSWANFLGSYWTWSDPNGPFLTPQIYPMSDGHKVWAHPNVTTDAVIRITLNGPGGTALVTGVTGSDASDTIEFRIFAGAEGTPPLWTGGVNQSFGLLIDYRAGDTLRLATASLLGDEKDWAWWKDVTIGNATTSDLNDDGVVDASDLGILLGSWGSCPDGCVADIDCSGFVDAADLASLLGAWTASPAA